MEPLGNFDYPQEVRAGQMRGRNPEKTGNVHLFLCATCCWTEILVQQVNSALWFKWPSKWLF